MIYLDCYSDEESGEDDDELTLHSRSSFGLYVSDDLQCTGSTIPGGNLPLAGRPASNSNAPLLVNAAPTITSGGAQLCDELAIAEQILRAPDREICSVDKLPQSAEIADQHEVTEVDDLHNEDVDSESRSIANCPTNNQTPAVRLQQQEEEEPQSATVVTDHGAHTTRPSKIRKYSIDATSLPVEMAKFVKELRIYFTKPVNLERQKPPISDSTFRKAQERLLCFLGFAKNQLGFDPSPDLFLRQRVIEQYITYLQDERSLTAATISNHMASLLYPAKFLHAELSPHYTGVKIIRQLRSQVAFYQRKANAQRPSSKEQLEAQNKWLDWTQIVQAVRLQRERLELARTAQAKASECADLLLLALYTCMPPSRGLEIRTLELLPPTLPMTSPSLANKNLVALDDEGGVKFKFQNYKTAKTYGSDTTSLQPTNEISRVLREYLKQHRQRLVNEASGSFLLVDKEGKPFSCSAFSAHLKFLFYRVTGVWVSINTLRSSFLTHAYSLSDCTDATKDSLAAALRHSRKHAQQTYDKRTADERKAVALSLAEQFVETHASDAQGQFGVGDFVGLVEESSTLAHPDVLIGQIQSFLPERQVRLLWYKETGKDRQFMFQFDASPWIEDIDAIHPVRMTAVKKKPGVFKLSTSPKSIHQALCP